MVMNVRGSRKRFYITIVLWIIVFEGVGAILFLFSIPSMDKSAVYFGFSKARLLLAIAALFAVLFFMAIAIGVSVSPRLYDYVYARVIVLIEPVTQYVNLLFTLIFWACLGVLLTAYINSPLVPDQNVTKAIFLRAQSIVIWASLICMQFGFVLRAVRAEATSGKVDYFSRESVRGVLVTAFIQFTLCQWAILILNIPVFTVIKDWYWHFYKRDLANIWLFPLLLIVALVVIHLALKSQTRVLIGLVMMMALGYLLQIGFGFVEGGGYQAIKERYMRGGRPAYAEVVSDSDFEFRDIFLLEYEGRGDYFIRTKPPGYLLLYASTQEIFNPGHTGSKYSDNLNHLVDRMSIIFPFISMLVVPVIALLAKTIGMDPEDRVLSTIVYISLPSVLLFTLQLDQVILPLLFSIGLLLGILTLRSGNIVYALITGAFLFMATLISYSLIALLPMLLIYFSLNLLPWVKVSITFRKYAKIFLALMVGFLLFYGIFAFLFDFELSSNFLESISFHELSKGSTESPRDFFGSIILNISELVNWLSLPLLILFALQLHESFSQISARRLDQQGVLFIASQLVLLGLLVMGSSQGEVARLWMFLFPLFSIFIASQLRALFQQRRRASLYYLLSILGTSLLMLKYQFPYQ